MKRSIPTDPGEYQRCVQRVSLRMQSSADWYFARRDRWRRCYSRWMEHPQRPDTIEEGDDYEMKLGYGFGLLEQIISKITEPLLNMGVPFGVFPTEEGDQPKATNFTDICRDFYSKPNVQMGKRKSKKEMAICGPRWEVDEWMHIVEPGKDWGEVETEVEEPLLDNDGKHILGEDGKPKTAKLKTTVVGEVDKQITTFYGFNTRYPSVFDMYPEPNRTTIDTGQKTDISWICEDMGELALEDMAREVIYDPAQKKNVLRYDFSKLIHDGGDRLKKRYENILKGAGDLIPDNYGPLVVPIHDWTDGQKRDDDVGARRSNDAVAAQSFEDRDKIWVAQMRMKNEIVTVCQGRYIIERVLDPWHRPRIGARIENYTIDPRSLFGPGALDPILDELDELDVTHSLGMQNLFRLVNKMVAVKHKALVSMDDMNPRAGGVVRINDEVDSVSSAIQAIVQPSAINEMLAGESNTKGNIEFTSSNHDNSPGIRNNKRQAKTATEVEALSVNIGTRFATMQAQGLINEALCGESMMYMFSQFAWEPMSYSRLRDDGSTVYSKFTKDDIDTKGRGFKFLVTVDPIWGNTQAQRQDARDLFELGIEYMKVQPDQNAKRPNLAVLFEDLLKTHGRRDTSRIFVMPTGEISPEQELQVLIGGGVVDGCRGDLRHHITTHLLQMKAPNLAKAIEAGKADPKTVMNLQLLIKQAMAEMSAFMRDPNAAAQDKLNKAGMMAPGGNQ